MASAFTLAGFLILLSSSQINTQTVIRKNNNNRNPINLRPYTQNLQYLQPYPVGSVALQQPFPVTFPQTFSVSPPPPQSFNQCICVPGLPGPPGYPGNPGQKGAPGRKGEKGDAGITGFPGRKGAKGDEGDRGREGSPGEYGEQGYEGQKGEKGDRGAVGFSGKQGQKGEKGKRGPKGQMGSKGEPGSLGSSILRDQLSDKDPTRIYKPFSSFLNKSNEQENSNDLHQIFSNTSPETISNIKILTNQNISTTDEEHVFENMDTPNYEHKPSEEEYLTSGKQGQNGEKRYSGPKGQRGSKGETGSLGSSILEDQLSIKDPTRIHDEPITSSFNKPDDDENSNDLHQIFGYINPETMGNFEFLTNKNISITDEEHVSEHTDTPFDYIDSNDEHETFEEDYLSEHILPSNLKQEVNDESEIKLVDDVNKETDSYLYDFDDTVQVVNIEDENLDLDEAFERSAKIRKRSKNILQKSVSMKNPFQQFLYKSLA